MDSLEGLSEEEIRSLASQMRNLASGDTRKDLQRLLKRKNPSLAIPEIDVEDAVEARMSERDKAFEELKARDQQRDIAGRREKIRQKLERDGLIKQGDDADFDDLEKVMVEKGIANHETAAVYRANERKLAEPAAEIPGRGGPMMMPADFKQFFKQPTQVARKLAHDAVTDIVNKRNRRVA